MNPEEQTPDFDESVREVMRQLPPPVRTYLALGKYRTVVQQIMQMYKLHVDEAGELENQVVLLLMGINSPVQFAQALQEKTHLSSDVVHGIIAEVNQQIFVPLHEQMRKAGAAMLPENAPQQAPARPAEPAAAIAPNTAAQTGVIHHSLLPSPAAPRLPVQNVQQAPMPPVRVPAPPPLEPRAPVVAPTPVSLGSATPMPAVEIPLPSHDVAPLPPRHVLPGSLNRLNTPQPLPMRGAPPPPNLPGVLPEFIDLHPPVSLPETISEEPAAPLPPSRPAPPQRAPVAPAAPYTVDPYREPPE